VLVDRLQRTIGGACLQGLIVSFLSIEASILDEFGGFEEIWRLADC
jgi:hypothetical protein